MLYFLESTNLHYSRSNVTMSRTRVNQNRNRLFNNLTCNFNHSQLVICVVVLQCCINYRDYPCYLSHYLCFLNVISWSCTFILKWTISAMWSPSHFQYLSGTLLCCDSLGFPPVLGTHVNPSLYRVSILHWTHMLCKSSHSNF